MTLLKYALVSVLLSGSVIAQRLDHSTTVSPADALPAPRTYRTAADTIDILAVMVQFQQDNSTLTSGDGRFDLTQGTDPIIDAPPHNRQYFLDHSTFAANYYRKASKGKVVVRTTVLDSIITLSGTMQDYSPPRTGSSIAVGNLARDAWQRVDAGGLVPDFSRYECFVVFHAGTGRDIDLVGILGYDPTPYDIPSLYIGLNGFRQYYGNTYQGISVNGGAFHITNSIVMPETENRSLPTATGTALLELSINGLLCASVGNFLGLPDLFDTNTGRSGIGRFGLMDGQAIFSFKGVFPPEPSAWEKYWLGWIEPIMLQAGEHTISLPAVSLLPADTVYRVPISAQEYYLVENRNRDAGRNGQRITSTFRGGSRVQTFPRDTTGFNAFELDSLAGVVTDVEDLDWSLPGGVNSDGTFFDGGVLIWHIDEAVIAQGLQTNGVNGNPLRRGVDVEEADGSQDIGQSYEFLSPGSGSEEGTALDFWYLGNGSPVNRNRFTPTSYPDSRSNSGANSHITISEFSARGPHMTAKVKLGDDVVKLLPGFPKSTGQYLEPTTLTAGSLSGSGGQDLVVATSRTAAFNPRYPPPPGSIPASPRVFAWKATGGPVLVGGSESGLFTTANYLLGFPIGLKAVLTLKDFNGDGANDLLLGEVFPSQRGVRVFENRDLNQDSLADELFSTQVYHTDEAPIIASDSLILVAASNWLYAVKFDGTIVDSLRVNGTSNVTGISRFLGPNSFLITQGRRVLVVSATTSPGSLRVNKQVDVGGEIFSFSSVASFGPSGSDVRVVVFNSSQLYFLDTNLVVLPGSPISLHAWAKPFPPALGDVDGDGSRDVVVCGDNKIFAFNRSGASLDNFPVTLPVNDEIRSAPIIADLNGDGNPEIVAVTSGGFVAACDKTGRMIPGFPLQSGEGWQSAVAFVEQLPLNSLGINLAVASSSGSVTAWRTGTTSFVPPIFPWPQYQRDAQHSGLALEPLTGIPLSSQFFPKERAYNWPNPVYDGKTFIRYFVKDDAAVNIKVFDLAGDLVTTIPNPPGIGGVDNEVEWNVADVQSGVYFARVEANGVGGSGVAVIKIAVVK